MSQTDIEDIENMLTLAKHNRFRKALEKMVEKVVREKTQREEVTRRLATQQLKRKARRRQRGLSLLPCSRAKRVKANDLRISWVKYGWTCSVQCPPYEYVLDHFHDERWQRKFWGA
ncbi:hypothetical protein LOD99_9983 [Oopsacas minuta]|uniref:Uncharacterized protein n=1 Tax=Oopsacas minuta TaxID=111878 RepID=A0AAV7KIV2_9METZ|nr:hypothetical protein LOD99_9983 [Oopsacas minuta]